MRVVFLTPEYVTKTSADGGLANYIKKTAKALSLRGCDVWVFVVADRDTIWQDEMVTVCEVKRKVFWLQMLSIFPFTGLIQVLNQLISSRRVAKKYWEIHKKKPFDIVQASSYMAPGYALLKNGKVPIVCRISSYSPVVRAAYGRKRSFGEYLSDWLEIRQVADAAASFAPSRFVSNIFFKVTGCEPAVIRTSMDIQEPILDYSFFNAHKPGFPYLLFFGTLSRIKGVDLLADVLPTIFERYGDLAVVFIGRDDGMSGGKKVFSHILESCEKYRERLFYHPALQKAHLYPFVANAEAILIPSRVDNYPNVCLEAQMFGKPVIGTYESSLDEMIVDGETGFLAKNADVESIKGAIEKFLNLTSEQRESMRLRIISHIEDIKREDRVGQLIDFYKEAINKFKVQHAGK
ncbi:MAG: glycosyltransferase family 4 protein [Deltaproteobacteria bacterium]|nr:glycosyltransferase family 4 protein [Deltaproteobacteria bacterium]